MYGTRDIPAAIDRLVKHSPCVAKRCVQRPYWIGAKRQSAKKREREKKNSERPNMI